MNRRSAEPAAISPRLIRAVRARLGANLRVRRTLPDRGRIHVDRQLPFLCVYRRPPGRPDVGTEQFVVGEAAYLQVSGDFGLRKPVADLVAGVVQTLSAVFGEFLIVEVWSHHDRTENWWADAEGHPGFTIVTSSLDPDAPTVRELQRQLAEITVLGRRAGVGVERRRRVAPPGLPPLLSPAAARATGCHILGLAVRPIHFDPATGTGFPLVRRALHRGITGALRHAVYQFALGHTTHRPPHYHALGRSALVKAVWEVDRELAEVSHAFDFLLQVSPVNAEAAWDDFRHARYEREPLFLYRPQPVDPATLKRKLHRIRTERLEDPIVGQLMRDKRDELDRQLTMLADRDTPRFLYGSLQLYGGVDDALYRQARQLLRQLPPGSRDDPRGGRLDAAAFARRARAEVAYYRNAHPALVATVEVRRDITGLLVSKGNLLVGHDTRIPATRVDALLQHEVGTHLLTYYNGRAQRFRQLYAGLPGYEELQEGLAVLAEHLVGGLSRPRLRLLAARVLAVRRLAEGASFVDAFRELSRGHGFSRRAAFNVTMRVYRGGGLTKDAVYLRGLVSLLEYLKGGGGLDPLFVGKIAMDHVPIIEELRWRGVLVPPPLRPRYMENPATAARLERVRRGVSLLALVDRRLR